MPYLLFTLLACNPLELEYSTETQGCQDWDPSSDTESTLNIYKEGEDLLIQRTGVIQNCEADFAPVIEQIDSYKLSIREYWNVSDAAIDCETCLSPTVRMTYPTRNLEFWWYVGENSISFDVVDTEQAEELPVEQSE